MGICSVGKTANICWVHRVNKPSTAGLLPGLLTPLASSSKSNKIFVYIVFQLLILCISSVPSLPGPNMLSNRAVNLIYLTTLQVMEIFV